jgi:hypothetical protein
MDGVIPNRNPFAFGGPLRRRLTLIAVPIPLLPLGACVSVETQARRRPKYYGAEAGGAPQ